MTRIREERIEFPSQKKHKRPTPGFPIHLALSFRGLSTSFRMTRRRWDAHSWLRTYRGKRERLPCKRRNGQRSSLHFTFDSSSSVPFALSAVNLNFTGCPQPFAAQLHIRPHSEAGAREPGKEGGHARSRDSFRSTESRLTSQSSYDRIRIRPFRSSCSFVEKSCRRELFIRESGRRPG